MDKTFEGWVEENQEKLKDLSNADRMMDAYYAGVEEGMKRVKKAIADLADTFEEDREFGPRWTPERQDA